ncbi:outer membrane receptor protein [Methylophilaceae bacterium 11]|uniref:TonB-dependent receptor n=1 Tax=unclassified Methylotenera TaxID=2643294 RepID=UPI00036546BE|nr:MULTISPECIES: TonB-dependent receptor [unclassified Methylotenera]EUJ10089.1 outer membrane receptor protein [Methylophilaceae bacterium 11]
MKVTFQPNIMMLAILTAYASPQFAFADEANGVNIDKIEVISTTPLKGIGLPLEQIPASIQTVKEKQLIEQKSISISDYINQNLNGVSVNDTQNNPYQPDVSFRGYSASPLLGTPQGLSVFVDGVRVNEPFGDVVNWDLIPMNSIHSINLIPGSNPLFGLNTLGGALSVQTKSGRTNPGGAIEAYMGSWGRKAGSAEFGGVTEDGSIDYFISGNVFSEDGWRDYSPSDVGQVFGKVGWQNEKTSVNLSFTGADNKLIGNGLAPADFLDQLGRDSILTRPDKTENKLAFVNLNWSHFFSDDVQLSGNTYYRKAKTKTLNGDGNDDFDDDDVDLDASGDIDAGELATANANCLADNDADENCSGAINRTNSRRTGYGFNAQLTFGQDLAGLKNQFVTGLGYDYGRTNFTQSTEYGLVNTTRGIDGSGIFSDDAEVNLKGVSKTWSVFATDTLSLSPLWHLTGSLRYNHTKVENDDRLVALPDPTSLSGNHSFNRINPAVGVNFTPSKDLTAFASYNEGSRAPTAIELGCANPDIGCRLPNAFAGDPPLKQVVAKTFEGGLRGNLTDNISWTFSAYRAENHDDIQFISSSATGLGYFDNVGKTRRQGFDTGISGRLEKFSWSAGYSFVKATYQSGLLIANEVNSSAQDFDGNGETEIQVKRGDRLPGIPQHQVKLRAAYDVTPAWSVGTNIIAFSDQYSRGNENNDHDGDGAKVSGYAVVNLDTRYNFGNGWQFFAKLNNVFDREYNNAGLLGEHRFDASTGQFTGNEVTPAFYAPGAPRAGWFGLRYAFGGNKSASSVDLD